VSIYPHTGLWTQRVQDGVRLAAASGRKNVGANFNLVHWAWVKQDQPLEKVLQQSLPHLFAITINGLDGRNIVPLDQGDYDVVAFIKLVKNIDYRGPVGLQGYGIPGPSRQSLARSMKKWREIMSSLHP
jgi:sugar phosphate isomerase/epimerase